MASLFLLGRKGEKHYICLNKLLQKLIRSERRITEIQTTES